MKKLFQMNDCNVVIAKDKKEAEDWYNNEFGCDDEAIPIRAYHKKHWWPVSNMRELEEIIDTTGKSMVGKWAGEVAVLLSFKNTMTFYMGDIPGIFSSTEF